MARLKRARRDFCVLDPRWLDDVDAVARQTFGEKALDENATVRAIQKVSAAYTNAGGSLHPVRNDREALLARLRFFTLRDLPKVTWPLSELQRAGALPTSNPWEVLDVGAGLGSTTLGVAQFASDTGVAERLHVTAVDADEAALNLFGKICAQYHRGSAEHRVPIELETKRVRLDHPAALTTLPGPFDLIVVGFTLNELFRALPPEEALQRRADVALGLLERLRPDGSLILLEPSLRATSRLLHRLRDELLARAPHVVVFAPCTHQKRCPMLASERDWCHEDVSWALAGNLKRLAQAAGLRFERSTFSYLTLRRANGNVGSLRTDGDEAFRVVSVPKLTKGQLELFVCGSRGLEKWRRMHRERTATNQEFERAQRGDIASQSGSEPVQEISDSTSVRIVRPGRP